VAISSAMTVKRIIDVRPPPISDPPFSMLLTILGVARPFG
jgi:hypothetical protein